MHRYHRGRRPNVSWFFCFVCLFFSLYDYGLKRRRNKVWTVYNIYLFIVFYISLWFYSLRNKSYTPSPHFSTGSQLILGRLSSATSSALKSVVVSRTWDFLNYYLWQTLLAGHFRFWSVTQGYESAPTTPKPYSTTTFGPLKTFWRRPGLLLFWGKLNTPLGPQWTYPRC